jgi:hypothetical protein
MGCGCNKGNAAAKKTMRWSVDLTGTGKKFDDGTTSKTYALASEAATAIAKLGLTGKVRPRPTTA